MQCIILEIEYGLPSPKCRLNLEQLHNILCIFSVFVWYFPMMVDLAIYTHEATESHIGFFFRVQHLWLFMSLVHIYSSLLCKHPLLMLTGGKELVWGLLIGARYQVIPLSFADLMWVYIELLCIKKVILKVSVICMKIAPKY